MTTTQTAATERIDQILREEHTGYTFQTLRNRFRKSYFDRTWTVKIPSGSEIEFDEADVILALFGPDSTIYKMFARRTGR